MPFTVLIPAVNESKGMRVTLESLARLGLASGEMETLVVDDGSTDDTAQVARDGGARVVQHESNRGYGAALKTGIRAASHDVIVIADADGAYPMEAIPELVRRITDDRCDMAVGWRKGPKAAIPAVRKPAKWVIGMLANYISGINIPDLNSGLRAFRRTSVEPYFHLLPDGFSFTSTITLAMLANGLQVVYEPIEYHPRVGRSKIRPIQDTANFVRLVLRIGLYFSPLKIFLPLSGALFLLAIAWGIFTYVEFERLADVSTLILAMASMQAAMFGLLAELINKRLPKTKP